MAENVEPIFGGPAPTDPVPDIVEMLEGLLEQARSGDLRGFAYAVARPGTAGEEWHAEPEAKFELVTAVAVLHHRIVADLADETR